MGKWPPGRQQTREPNSPQRNIHFKWGFVIPGALPPNAHPPRVGTLDGVIRYAVNGYHSVWGCLDYLLITRTGPV